MQRRLSRSTAAFAIIAAAALVLPIATWMREPHGGLPALSFDSFRYLAGAYSFLGNGTYLDLDGTPQRVWPPGTSILYAGLSRVTSRSPEELPGAIGLATYLIAMAACAFALRACVNRTWLASIAFAAIAWNTFTISMTNKLWSDPIALACLSVALALLIAGGSSPRIIVAATLAIFAGIAFRYAMIAALALPLWAAWRIRVRAIVPLTAAAVAGVVFVVARRVGGLNALPLRDDVASFETLAAQFLPSKLGIAGLILVVIAIVISVWAGKSAAVVAAVWLAAYAAFLFAAQAVAHPSFGFDLRILIPLQAAIVIVIASAADALLDRRAYVIAALLAGLLVLTGAKALHGLIPPHEETPGCTTQEQLVAALRTRPIGEAQISSNAQGVVWYALRRPVRKTPAPGDAVVRVDPSRACDGIVETTLPPLRGTRVIALP